LERWEKIVEIPELDISGKVVKGFGRGSKQLGVPTANIQMTSENKEMLRDFIPGVYIGKAKFGDMEEGPLKQYEGQKFQAAMNVGWSPQYDNPEKTFEVFLLHEFVEDFYGANISV